MIERLKENIRRVSPKQRMWIQRNRLLWRLKGMSMTIDPDIVTAEEGVLLKAAFKYIRQVCDNSTKSSRELGFNAVPRCKYCGKPLDATGKCKKCDYKI